MNYLSPRLRFFRILVVALLAHACSSAPPREDAYYDMAPPQIAWRAAHTVDGVIQVAAFNAQSFARSRAIAFRDAKEPRQVQRYHYHYWADAPNAMLERLTIEVLRQSALSTFVVSSTQRSHVDWIVSGNLVSLEHLPYSTPPQVRITLDFSVTATAGNQTIWSRSYSERENAGDNSLESAIDAFERALTRLLTRFVRDLDGRLTTFADTTPG